MSSHSGTPPESPSPFCQNTTSLEHPLAFIRMLVDRSGAMLLHLLLRSVDETGFAMAGLTSDELT
jgi:hypothetical protein